VAKHTGSIGGERTKKTMQSRNKNYFSDLAKKRWDAEKKEDKNG
jgi:hypothetical protein